MHTILIVDDESEIRGALQGVLEDEGYKTLLAASGEDCIAALVHKPVDVVMLDIWLPGIDGLETLERIVEKDDPPEVIMISGHGNIETAVRATKLGAFDFLEKPLSLERTLIVLKNAIEAKRLRSENLEYKKQFQARSLIVGDSIPMKALRQQISLMAPTNGRVLIYGESGTGKELVARAIHACSPRAAEPFVSINCGAFPETLLESELFGYVKGAFTGATQNKAGLFEVASGGTVFLDEISEMSLAMQVKLLRVLQERVIRPVGGTAEIAIDVRLIAATNNDLDRMVADGAFREDLYYRISVIPIEVPPLRDRREDIPLLANHFLKKYVAASGKSIVRMASPSLHELQGYDWPGNVRQLENTIERAVAMESGDELNVELPAERSKIRVAAISGNGSVPIPTEGLDMERYVADLERTMLQTALRQSGGVQTRAAQLLRLSYRSFRHLAKKYDI